MSKTPKHIIERIQRAREEGKTKLYLQNASLSEIPEEIFNQDSFEEIWLNNYEVLGNHNKIRSVPARVLQLKKLRWLVLFGNPLEEIADVPGLALDFAAYQKFKKPLSPAHLAGIRVRGDDMQFLESLQHCPALTLLDLSDNKLTQLPESVVKLQNLTSLYLANNQLTQLPESVVKLQNLTSLYLADNQLTQLPESLAKLQSLTSLNLGGNQLTQLPESVATLQNLTSLDLRGNQLTQLPESVATLQNLTELDLGGNQFTQLPESVAKLQSLTSLNLGGNQLTQLPESLAKLQSLTSLNLGGNQLSQLQESVATLQSLTSLNLGGNQLTQLPESVAKLQNLTELNLGGNQLTQLPENLAKLQNLTSLDLSENQLTQLPESLAKLQNLTSLDLSENQLTQLPESLAKLQNLTELNLSRNRIQTLPAFITQFKNIQTIYFKEEEDYHFVEPAEIVLSENPIQYPPLEVAAAGMDAVRSFFRQQAAQGKEKLFEAKLILVGEPGAGKTSLMKKLLDEAYPIPNPADKSTVGITVKTGWQFPYVKDNARRFAANLWDFGGQDIQYMTHQFFLTSRALYVLLVDDRKQHTQFDYWFNIIKLLGAGSPVLVVLNERDCRSITNFDYDSFRKYYENDFTIKKCEVDLAEVNLNRFCVLRDQIQTMLCELPHVGAELPAQWIPIRQELEKRRLENHLTLEDYSRICAAHQIAKLEDQLVLSQYLHYLGIILHFQEDPQLAETVFLNPQWVVHAVYTVLESDHAKKNKGRFSRNWMFDLWQQKGYSFAERNKLLTLMLKNNFELCYPIESGSEAAYIAPQLLPGLRPDYPWPEQDNLHFRFQYQFMPKGIITRLIVRLNHLIARRNGEDLVWEKGVVLHKDGARAQVTEEITKHEGLKVINLTLAGPAQSRMEFLSDLRAEIRGIHEKSFKGINVKEMAPIPWQPEIAVSYQLLRRLEALGEREYIVEGVEQPVPVARLLNGIEPPSERRKIYDEFREGFKVEVHLNNPQTVTQTVTQSNVNQAQAESRSEFNFTAHLNGLQTGLSELREEAEAIAPEAAQEIAAIQQKLDKLEQTPKPEAVKKAGVMNKLKRFFDEANDTGTTLGKTVDKIKGGYKILQGLAGQYNKIAGWCGLPQVPSVLVKNSNQ